MRAVQGRTGPGTSGREVSGRGAGPRLARRVALVGAALAALGALTGCAGLPFGEAQEPTTATDAVEQAPATVADLPPLDGVVAGVPDGWAPASVGRLQLAVPADWADLGVPSSAGWEHRKYARPAGPALAAQDALAVSDDGAVVVTRTLEVSALVGESTWRGGWSDMTGQEGYRLEVPGAELAAVDLTTGPAFDGATTETLTAEIHLQSEDGAYVVVELVLPAGEQGLAELRAVVGTLTLS
ncbi:hypothetical protein ICW40_14105 [Actinotalea ferrariae]|uniref:hypothetical protein n=1 Tax=Actinotalea ferrariae TaxID=1386098 RepID=UPI001C8B6D09|nr:hypothetical protein [Actinotalea ferrariae]MBX9245938.1 hypothetical protein [Actinotalea ferrariae]